MNSLLFFRSWPVWAYFTKSKEKGHTFQKPSNYQFFHKVNLPLANHLKLQCVCTSNRNFLGAKVYTKLQHIRILPSPKSTAFHSCLLTHAFHLKTDWQPLFYQKYIMAESRQQLILHKIGEPNCKTDSFWQKIITMNLNSFFPPLRYNVLDRAFPRGISTSCPQQATSFDGFSKI